MKYSSLLPHSVYRRALIAWQVSKSLLRHLLTVAGLSNQMSSRGSAALLLWPTESKARPAVAAKRAITPRRWSQWNTLALFFLKIRHRQELSRLNLPPRTLACDVGLG